MLFQTFYIFQINFRLNTNVSSDRIVILEKGEVVEFDSPKTLFKVCLIINTFNEVPVQKKDSFFRSLVEASKDYGELKDALEDKSSGTSF